MKQNKALISCTGIEFVQLICFSYTQNAGFLIIFKEGSHTLLTQINLFCNDRGCGVLTISPVIAIFIIFAKHMIFNTPMQNY